MDAPRIPADVLEERAAKTWSLARLRRRIEHDEAWAVFEARRLRAEVERLGQAAKALHRWSPDLPGIVSRLAQAGAELARAESEVESIAVTRAGLADELVLTLGMEVAADCGAALAGGRSA